MTPVEADTYARKIHSSFPGPHHVTLDEWAEELRELDAGTVGTAIVRLRREQDRPPTIHQLRDAYHGLHTPARQPLPEPDCTHCSGDGWITVHYLHDSHPSRGAAPCPACGERRRTRHAYAEVLKTPPPAAALRDHEPVIERLREAPSPTPYQRPAAADQPTALRLDLGADQ